ncbi:MAG: hypothetical protein P0S96_05845 [Simkaniaceae bacterium]|nr:hypothetical protein [Candidatus Sacchlamyda saccharinae]
MDQLISDTIAYLRQEGYDTTRPPIKKEEPVSVKPPPPPPVKQVPSPMNLASIQKHLPHIKLVQNIPTAKEVAIVVTDKEELPFLKNLARAIQNNLCSVKLLAKPNNLESYTLVLAQEEIEGLNILLKKSTDYENHPEEKKALWTQLCQLLK